MLPESKYKKTLPLEDFLQEYKFKVCDFICSLCKGVLNQPVADYCGHLFCQKCFETYLSTSQICPVTRSPLVIDQPIEMPTVRNYLNKMYMKCKNNKEGCTWKGQLKELNEHINNHCKKQKIKCENIGCKLMIKREDIKEHLKQCRFKEILCADCGVKLIREQIEYHRIKCPKLKMECIQGCKKMVPRDEMNTHLVKECDNSKMLCNYAKLGCKKIIMRKEQKQHEKENFYEHAIMIYNDILGIKENMLHFVEEEKNKRKEVLNEYLNLIVTDNLSEMKKKYYYKKDEPESSKKSDKEDSSEVIDINNENEESITFLNQKTHRAPNNIPNIKNELLYEEDSSLDNNNNNIENLEYYQFDSLSDEISINGAYARCNSNISKESIFVFCNYTISKKRQKNIFTFSIFPSSSWIGLGLCDKDLLKENNLKLSSHINNGLFIISTNGYTWNSNELSQNEMRIPNFVPMLIKEDITFEYKKETKDLIYSFGNRYSGKLINVYPTKSKKLTACIVFMNENDEVKFSF